MAAKKVALIDLDGTLLPMDTAAFMRAFLAHVGQCCAAALGMAPAELSDKMGQAVSAMVNGSNPHSSNADSFWAGFERVSGKDRPLAESILAQYYQGEFSALRSLCGQQPLAGALLRGLAEQGYELVLATNPIFPRIAIEKRLRWAGIAPEEFVLISHYENCHSAKPDQAYYLELLHERRATPRATLMIGNHVFDDILPANNVGMRCYFLTDCAINPHSCPRHVARGDFRMLLRWVEAL